jgi:hypothetical protein
VGFSFTMLTGTMRIIALLLEIRNGLEYREIANVFRQGLLRSSKSSDLFLVSWQTLLLFTYLQEEDLTLDLSSALSLPG